MNVKKIVGYVLLLFVVVSFVELAIKKVRQASAGANEAAGEPAPHDLAAAALAENHVVACYAFTSSGRCESCDNYETWAKEAIDEHFAQAIKDGRLAWQTVDFDLPEGKRFDSEYELGRVPTLVLIAMRGRQRAEWKALHDGLMHAAMGSKAELKKYVQSEVRDYLEAK
jgi:hypothetical protein